MSIHKSQGQTLSRVKVDLAKVFEKGTVFFVLNFLPRADHPREPGSGQAYVALSRATSLDGLQVLNFNPSKARLPIHVFSFALYSPCCSGVCPRQSQGMERKVGDDF